MQCSRLMSPEKNLKLEWTKLSDLNSFKGNRILSLNVTSLLPIINLLRNDLVNIIFDAFTNYLDLTDPHLMQMEI